ncbi:Gfo/Idh/MocA family protein [Streptosporangium sandarakinum]
MPGTELTWGIAGYGDIVRRRALPGLLSLSQRVAVVWGRDAARARALADEHGVPLGTSDYAELLRAVDVVYVATPVAAHVPLAAAAVRAGLPVLVEKPLGLFPLTPAPYGGESGTEPYGGALGTEPYGGAFGTGSYGGASARGERPAAFRARPADGLRAELAAPGAHVGVAYYRRLAPAVVRLAGLLAGRAVHRVTLSFRAPFDPAPGDPRAWRTDPAESGGGVLADIGSHRLDLLVRLLGEPVTVDAVLGARFPRGAERAARVELSWPSGARASLDAEWAPAPPYDRMAVTFDGGRVELDPLDAGRIRGVVDGAPIDEHLPPAANPHAPLLADFARSVRYGTAPACPFTDAALVDDLIAAAYRAAAPPPSAAPFPFAGGPSAGDPSRGSGPPAGDPSGGNPPAGAPTAENPFPEEIR